LKKRAPHSTFNGYALFLALLIFTAFGGKALHILLEHSHKAVEICDAKAGDVHLHDYAHLEHSCDLCDFTFSFFELNISTFYLNLIDIWTAKKSIAFHSFKLSATYLFQSSRGPPAF
jgi:hypothetical protein